MEPVALSGTKLAQRIAAREISVVEVVEQALVRATQVQARLNPFVTLSVERAREEAKAADARLHKLSGESLPPLFGVPFTVKDLLDTQGVRTTYASEALAENVPLTDAVAVARMRTAGAILIGKTTTSEFASKVTTDSQLCGATLNPWAPSLSAGGSSGGAGVVAATSVASLSVSTDGGGSSRIPGAVCGVLGFKVTMGAIPHETWPFHYGNNSSISLNCRYPEDLVAQFNVMSGAHPLDPWSRRSITPLSMPHDAPTAVNGKRAVFIPAPCGAEVDTEYLALTRAAVNQLSGCGLRVDVESVDPTGFDPATTTAMMVCNLAARVRQMPAEQQQKLGPVLQGLLHDGDYLPSAVRMQADAIDRSRAYDRLEQILSEYDYVLSPTLTTRPPSADPAENHSVVINGQTKSIAKWWTHLSLPNMTGHPAISIPCGTDSVGLPVGLHAIAGWDKEQDLIDLACTLSTFNAWNEAWPTLSSA